MSAPRSSDPIVENLIIMITGAPRRVNIDNVQINDIDNSRIVDNVHIHFEITSDVDEIVKTSTPTLDEVHIHKKNNSDVWDALVESNTPIPDDMDVSEDDTSDSEHVLMESNIFVQVVRYSLVIPMIKDRTEHEITDTSVVNLVSHLSSLVYVVVM